MILFSLFHVLILRNKLSLCKSIDSQANKTTIYNVTYKMKVANYIRSTEDKKYIKIAYFYKFIFWPASILLIIFIDKTFIGFLNEEIYKVLFLFSVVPLAGNTVTLAVLLKARPEKASFTVLLSTLISVVYIPIVLIIYGGF